MVLLAVSFLWPSVVHAYTAASIMDADSGRILYSENGDKKYLIASTTKIMTALVAIKIADLDALVTAGDEVLEAYGSSVYLKPKETMTMRDLLYGLLLRSGNDAALTIAKNAAGSVEEFVRLMNDEALYIGMHDTTFSNPHGLDNETENKSTTDDMCLLMRTAMQSEEFRHITSTKKYDVKSNFGTYEWYNKNRLLEDYKYATGGKIGYTPRARHTFVSSATKDDKNLIIATFGDADRFATHKKLYESYMKKYEKYKVIDAEHLNINYKPGYRIFASHSLEMLLTKEEEKRIKREVILYDDVRLESGASIIGEISASLDGKTYGKMKIYAESIEKPKTWWDKIKEFFKW